METVQDVRKVVLMEVEKKWTRKELEEAGIPYGNTAVYSTKDRRIGYIRVYDTTVMDWTPLAIYLRHDGWKTRLTKNRINSMFAALRIEAGVYSKKGDWYVSWTDRYGSAHHDAWNLTNFSLNMEEVARW